MLRPEAVAQGDIFDDVAFLVRDHDRWVREVGLVMVIAHSCEYTKAVEQRERPLGIAPLVDLADLPPGQPELVLADAMSRYWALPQDDPLEWGTAVDFANIQPLLAEDLEEATRLTSINDFGQMALAGRLFTFYAQREFGT